MIKKSVQDYKTINLQKNYFDIIGDIHGCYYELIELVEKLGYVKYKNAYFHKDGRRLISVGDIADKGYKNIDCYNFWINQVNYGGGIWVYGNHCLKFYKYLLGNKIKITYNISKTVSEYMNLPYFERISFRDKFIKCYEGRSHYVILDNGKLVVVHACLKENDIGKFNDAIRTRCLFGDVVRNFDGNNSNKLVDWALEYRGEPFIVYGHNAVLDTKIVNNTIDVDTGCVYGGKLTAFRYPEKEIVQVKSRRVYMEYMNSDDIDFANS